MYVCMYVCMRCRRVLRLLSGRAGGILRLHRDRPAVRHPGGGKEVRLGLGQRIPIAGLSCVRCVWVRSQGGPDLLRRGGSPGRPRAGRAALPCGGGHAGPAAHGRRRTQMVGHDSIG